MSDLATIDLRGVPCPLSFVRAKLRLEKLQPGDILEIWLDRGEPIEQVPNSLKVEGHLVQEIAERHDFFALTVRKA